MGKFEAEEKEEEVEEEEKKREEKDESGLRPGTLPHFFC
jgi:hypothetical protein